MPFKLPNAVQETTTTSGTGALTLLGAVASRKAFSSQLATGDTVAYVIEDGTDWECGIGTFTAPSTLSRDTVIYSTNGNALVVWPASGTRNVYVAAIGAMFAGLIDPMMANGLIAKTADRTYAARSIAVSSDLSITNPTGTAGNPTLALAFAVSAFAKTFLDDADAAAVRATLGLGSAAVEAASTSDTANAVVKRNASGEILLGGVALGKPALVLNDSAFVSGAANGAAIWTSAAINVVVGERYLLTMACSGYVDTAARIAGMSVAKSSGTSTISFTSGVARVSTYHPASGSGLTLDSQASTVLNVIGSGTLVLAGTVYVANGAGNYTGTGTINLVKLK